MRLREQWKTLSPQVGSERFPGGRAVPRVIATLGGLARWATGGLQRSALAMAVSLAVLAHGGTAYAQTLSISSFAIISNPATASMPYAAGETIRVRMTLSSAAVFAETSSGAADTGMPLATLELDFGGNVFPTSANAANTKTATYSTTNLPTGPSTTYVFEYLLQEGDVTLEVDEGSGNVEGIAIAAGRLTLAAGVEVQLDSDDSVTLVAATAPAMTRNTAHTVADTTAPSIVTDGITFNTPENGEWFGVGENIDITVTFNEPVEETSGSSFLNLTIHDGYIRTANLLASSEGTMALMYRYRVIEGDRDDDGVSITRTNLFGTIVDAAGNAYNVNSAPGANGGSNTKVDGRLPTVSRAEFNSPASLNTFDNETSEEIQLTVTFSENVTVEGTVPANEFYVPFQLGTGTTERRAIYDADASSGANLVFTYAVQSTDEDADGIELAAADNIVLPTGVTIEDRAGNELAAGELDLDAIAAAATHRVGPLTGATQPVTFTAQPSTFTEGGGVVDVFLTASLAGNRASGAIDITLDTPTADVTFVGDAPTITIRDGRGDSGRVLVQIMVTRDTDSDEEVVQLTATSTNTSYTLNPIEITIAAEPHTIGETRYVEKQLILTEDGVHAWNDRGDYNPPNAISSQTLPTELREGAGENQIREVVLVGGSTPTRLDIEFRHPLPASLVDDLVVRFEVDGSEPQELNFGDASTHSPGADRHEYQWSSGLPNLPASQWFRMSIVQLPPMVTLTAVPATVTEGGGIVDVVLTARADSSVGDTALNVMNLTTTSDDVTIVGTAPTFTIPMDGTESPRVVLQLMVAEDADTGDETIQFTATTDNSEYVVTPLDLTIGDSTLAADQTRLVQKQLQLGASSDGATNGWNGDGTTYPDEYLSSVTVPTEVRADSGDGSFAQVLVQATPPVAVIRLDRPVPEDLRSRLFARFVVGDTVTDLRFREGDATEATVGQAGQYTWTSGVPATTADSWITLSLIQNEPTPVTITANSSTAMNPVTVTEGGGTVELRLNASVPAGRAPNSSLTITLAGTSTGDADSDDFTIVGYFTSQGEEDSAMVRTPPVLTIASGETDADEVYVRMTVPLGADNEPEETITLAATLSGTNSSAFTSDGLDIIILTTQPAAGETRIAEKQVNMATDTGTGFSWDFEGNSGGDLSSTDFTIGNQSFRYSIILGDIVSGEVTRMNLGPINKAVELFGDHSFPNEDSMLFRFTTSRGTHDLKVDDATEDGGGNYVWRATHGLGVQAALAALTIMKDEWFTLTLIEGPPPPGVVTLSNGSMIRIKPEADEVSEAATNARVRITVSVLGTLPAAVDWDCRLHLASGTVEAGDFARLDDVFLSLHRVENDSATCTWSLTDDTIVEPTEMAVVQVIDPGPTAGAGDEVLIGSATINVTSDDAATVSVASADSEITEGPAEDSGDPDMDVTVTITRSAPATTAIEALPVRWTLSGDAAASDFLSTDSELGDALAARQLSGTITIPAGNFDSGGTITRTVTWQVSNDDDDEADSESFTLTFSSPAGWPSVTAPSATIAGTIADNESNQDTNPLTVSIFSSDPNAVEPDSGTSVTGSAATVTVEVSRDAPTGGFSFPLTLTLGDDIEDNDWELRDSGGTMVTAMGTGSTRTITATIAEDARRFAFTVHALDDNFWEHPAITTAETITVSLPATGTESDQLGAGLQQDADAADQSTTITLVNSDPPPQIVLALGTPAGTFSEDDAANFMNTITASIPATGSSVFPTGAELWLALVPVASDGAVFLDANTADANSDIYFTPGRDQEEGDDDRWDIPIPTGVTGTLTDVAWTVRVTNDPAVEADETFAVRAEVIGEDAAAASAVTNINTLTLGTLANTDVVEIGFSESAYTITEGHALNTTDGVAVTYSTPMTAEQIGDDEAWITVTIERLGDTARTDFNLVALDETNNPDANLFDAGLDIGGIQAYYFFPSAGVTSEVFPLQFLDDGVAEVGEQVRLRFWFSDDSVDPSHPAHSGDGESEYVGEYFGVGAHHTTTITIVDAAPGEHIRFTTTPVVHQGAICLNVSWTNPSGEDFPYHSLVRTRVDGSNVVTVHSATSATGDMLGVPYTSPNVRDCTPADQQYRYAVRRFPETAGDLPEVVAHADKFLPRAPAAVTNVQYEPPTAARQVGRLTWDELAEGLARGYSTITGYEVWYQIDGDVAWHAVDPPHTGTERSYSDGIAWKRGGSIRFHVGAKNVATELLPDANRSWGSVTYTATGTAPGAVTLTVNRATVQGDDRSFPSDWISWTAPAEMPLGYLVYLRTVNTDDPFGPFTVVTPSLPASALTYGGTIMGAKAVEYWVQAFSLAGGGDLSNGVTVSSVPAPVAETVAGDTAVGLRGFAEVVDVDGSRSNGGNTIPAGETGEFNVAVTRENDAFGYRNLGFGGERVGVGFRVGAGQWLRWVDEGDLAACAEVLFCGVRRSGNDFNHYPADGRRSQWLLVGKGSTNTNGIGRGESETFKIYVPPTVTGTHAYEYGFARLTDADEFVWLRHGVAAPGVPTHRPQFVRGPTVVTSFTTPTITGRQVQLDWEMSDNNAAWIVVERQGGGSNTWAQVCCNFAPNLGSYTDEPPAGTPDTWTYRITAHNHDGVSVEFDQRPRVNLGDGTQDLAVNGQPRFAASDQDMVVRLMVGVAVDHALPAATGGTAPLTYAISDVTGVGLELQTVMDVPRLQGTVTVGTGMDAVTGTATAGAAWATLTATDADGDMSDPLRLRIVVGETPAAPQSLRAIGGAQHIGLAWRPPTGTVAFTGYHIEQSPDGTAGSWTILVDDTLSNGTSFVHTGLSGGQTVHYRVAAINQLGYGTFSESASATTAPTVVPTSPVGLTAEASTGNVQLTWQAPALNGGALITGYRIEQQLEGTSSTWAVLVDDTGLSVTTYTVHDVWPDLMVRYRVAARNSVGLGPFSNTAQTIVPLVAPPAPTDLVAVAGKGQVTLRWNAPTDTIRAVLLGYQIQRSDDGSAGSWTDLEANTGSLDTEYVHTGFMDGVTVHYQVAAINTVGPGAFATAVSATTLMAGVPAAPPRVEAIGTHGGIQVSWSVPGYDGGGAITNYNVQTSTTGESDSWPSTDARSDDVGNVTSHDDTGVAAGTTKYYRVAAINATGIGAWSAVVSATSLGAQPQAPALTGMSGTLPTLVVRLTTPARGPNAATANEYVLESSASGAPGSWSHFATFMRSDLREGSGDADATSARLFIGAGDPRLPLPQYFRLFAANSSGRSPPSEAFCRVDCEPTMPPTMSPTPAAPGVPVGLVATGGRKRIVLRWQPPASDGGSRITGYKIEVSTDGQTFTDLEADTTTRATQYVHSGLGDGVTRHYQVSAINIADTGDASAPQAATTLSSGHLDPPRQLTVTWDADMNQAQLRWLAPTSDGGSAITSYRIELSKTATGPWEAVAAADTASVTSFMYVHSGASAHGINYYRVFATNANGMSSPSSVVRSVATATAPRDFMAFQGYKNHLLVWDLPEDLGGGELLGWRLGRRDTEADEWGVRRSITARLVDGHLDYANTNRTKRYRLAAVTSLGLGAWSEEIVAVTMNDQPNLPRELAISTASDTCVDDNLRVAAVLNWIGPFSESTPGTYGYRVDRRFGDRGEWETLRDDTTAGASGTTYEDCTLSPGDRVTYRVFAVACVRGDCNTAGLLGAAVITPTVVIPGQVPVQVPTGLRVVSDFARSLITWQRIPESVNPDITGYRIEYAPLDDPENYQLFGAVRSRRAESFARTDEDSVGGAGYYRIAHLVGSTVGAFSAPAVGEMVGAEVVLDLNEVGGLTEVDANILYLAYEFPELVGEGFNGAGFTVMRRLLFGQLVNPADQNDVFYRGMLHNASELQREYGGTALDVNQDGDFDADDVLILFYAYEMQEQLGDGGEATGDQAIRETFLAPLADEANPTDAELRELLQRANALNPQ